MDVNSDGDLAIGYYDFTNDSPTDDPLVTDYWIVRSYDGGATFDRRERLTATSFDMRLAPNTRGFFVGDYTGLDSAAARFQTLYAVTTPTAGNPTDMISQSATGHTSESDIDEGLEVRRAGQPRPVLTATGQVRRC